jgi:hypothetical protein
VLANAAPSRVVNCTIIGNTALPGGAGGQGPGGDGAAGPHGPGGGVWHSGGPLDVVNTILWSNADGSDSGEAAQIAALPAEVSLAYSCIQGCTGAFAGLGNTGSDPRLADPLGRPGPSSWCIDGGSSDALPPGTVTDADGRPRRVDNAGMPDTGCGPHPTVDIGAFESQDPTCYANCDESTGAPLLNISDFICFQARFVAADPYANCDASTAAPTLNIADFVCFMGRFSAACP